MKDLFFLKRKQSITLTVIILSCSLLSLVYQYFFVHSKSKLLGNAIFNSEAVYYNSSISDTICGRTIHHDLQYFIFSDYKGGCYFGEDEVIDLIDSFVVYNETVMKKRKNDSTIRFINKEDTLVITYEVNKEYGYLSNGKEK